MIRQRNPANARAKASLEEGTCQPRTWRSCEDDEDFGRGDIPGVLAKLGPEAVAENVLGVLPANFDEFAVVPLAFLRRRRRRR